MNHRIITHASCVDGYSSAFLFKKYLAAAYGLAEDQLTTVIGLQPRDIQEEFFDFEEGDIVLDLPKPKKKVFLWIDHHASNEQESYSENEFFKVTPSCASYIIDIAKEKGIEFPPSIEDFRKVIDKTDNAEYSKEDIKEIFYLQDNYDNPSMLTRVAMVSSIIKTKDFNLNTQALSTLLNIELGDTPVTGVALDNMIPTMFYRAQLIGYKEWRKAVDTFLYMDDTTKAVIQDDRKVRRVRGCADRFYIYMKYDTARYGVTLKPMDPDLMRIGIGGNIFHKDWNKVDIGKLCNTLGTTYGDGSGGGHFAVGGAVIHANKTDEALKFILDALKE